MSDVVLLLGNPDKPTDALRSYALRLGEQLQGPGRAVCVATVRWGDTGWIAAFRSLKRALEARRPDWVLLQYTPLAWGPRGFPLYAPLAARLVRRSGARLGVSFHDGLPSAGERRYDRVRTALQLRTMRRLARRADVSFVHVRGVAGAPWMPASITPVFTPSGSNITPLHPRPTRLSSAPFTVVVFGMSAWGDRTEGDDLVAIMRRAASGLPEATRLLVVGRGSEHGRSLLEAGLAGSGIALEIRGLLPEEEVSAALFEGDVTLFLRGGISSRRGTAAAALAHGLPLVAYESDETAPPITDAGVICVAPGDIGAAADALVRVAGDDALRATLAHQSTVVHDRYFAWEQIGKTVATAMFSGET